jgi:uncharacterized protein YkwD
LCSKEWSSSPVKASQTRLFTAPQPFQQFSWLPCCLKTTDTNQSPLDLKFSQAFSVHNYLRKKILTCAAGLGNLKWDKIQTPISWLEHQMVVPWQKN